MNGFLRLFGAILMITPFANFILSIAMLPPAPDKWTYTFMSTVFFAATPMQWALRISKVVVGYLMFRAKSSAWLPVLVILAVTIAYNFLTFSRDFKTNSFQAVASILINLVLFGLVLSAEVKSQKEMNAKLAAARAAKTKSSTTQSFAPEETSIASQDQTQEYREFQIVKGGQIDFEGHGLFAEIIHIQDDELWIRGTSEAPLGITSRTVILESSEEGVSVRLQYHRNDGPDVMVFKVA